MVEEELEKQEAMGSKYTRKLNFNAPLLSTRRIGGYTGEDQQSCTNSSQGVFGTKSDDRIPFSWELAPGKPKKDLERSTDIDEVYTPRPRPPPCLWHPAIESMNDDYPHDDNNDAIDDVNDCCDVDIDFDFDVDVDVAVAVDVDDDAAFSDAMDDVFSLSEAIDIVTKAEKVHELDSLKLKLEESRGSESPNFIIRRFLPDATALAAASSGLAFNSMSFNKRPSLPRQCNCPETCEFHPVIRQSSSYASPKGCGLETLFPWRMKRKLCGIKNPIRHESLNVQQPQCRAKQKKHSSSNCKSLPI